MSKCLQRNSKECDVNASDLRAVLEYKLLKEISIRYVNQIDEPANLDFVKDILIYDSCWYILHTRKSFTKLEDCFKSVRCEEIDLPPNFSSDPYTTKRNHGYPPLHFRHPIYT
ncbi:hypothetical protein OUZ56_024085 [Daphnia magna]|uniref:Uncharacterized protein n=1 Tax=Daphnia magna TaxID=35525 RepID=A0ABR0B032_9CRUS|nr:hypothetical protein OUZ56_024085 [Daphnia magna]